MRKPYLATELIIKAVTPILISFAAWVFYQFWDTTRELKAEFYALRVEILKQNEECKVGVIRLENMVNYHVWQTEQKAKQ
jgi:hypothetical protein